MKINLPEAVTERTLQEHKDAVMVQSLRFTQLTSQIMEAGDYDPPPVVKLWGNWTLGHIWEYTGAALHLIDLALSELKQEQKNGRGE